MKQIWTGTDPLMLTLLRSELDARGVRYLVKNERLMGLMPELPVFDVWPEVWIDDDAASAEAQEIVRQLVNPEQTP